MNTVLRVGVALLFLLACFGSAWYIAFRLRTTFGLQGRWPLRVLVMAALVGSFLLMVSAPKSADVVAGLWYVLSGYLFAGYVFLTLATVLPARHREGVAHTESPRGCGGAASGGRRDARRRLVGQYVFGCGDRDCTPRPGPRRRRDELSDIHVGHHRGRKYSRRSLKKPIGEA